MLSVLAPARTRAAVREPARVCFLYIAQAHQVLHSLSAAVELARRCPDVKVEVAAGNADVLGYAWRLVEQLGGAPIDWRILGPAWLRPFALSDGTLPKVPLLLAEAARLARYDVIVAPERTTALLKSLGPNGPKLVYTQHGAGDRGGPFEPRLRRFDLVFAAGAKQRDRMIDEGLVTTETCAVVGYPKFDLVERLGQRPPRLFADERPGDERPTVLYNPHFDARLSSWPRWGLDVLQAFARQDDYNLIFAPHLRLFGGRAPDQVKVLRPFLDHPRLHMDLGGTTAAIDMTYARMADVYVGDASSQIYEFIERPRPCLFLNAHGAAWQGDESYRHWRLGPVLDEITDLPAQVAAARRGHAGYLAAQEEGRRYTFDDAGASASARAAEAIARLVGQKLAARVADAEPAPSLDLALAS